MAMKKIDNKPEGSKTLNMLYFFLTAFNHGLLVALSFLVPALYYVVFGRLRLESRCNGNAEPACARVNEEWKMHNVWYTIIVSTIWSFTLLHFFAIKGLWNYIHPHQKEIVRFGTRS